MLVRPGANVPADGLVKEGVSDVNEAMKIAGVHALANLARAEASDIVLKAYGGQSVAFGPDFFRRQGKSLDPDLFS